MERSTRQRSAIRQTIAAAGRPLSPQEVLQAAQTQVPGLSLATVYRNLKLLQDAAEVSVVSLPGDSPRYESTQAASTAATVCAARLRPPRSRPASIRPSTSRPLATR